MTEQQQPGMVSIVIPAYNEPALPGVVADVQAELERLGRPYEIIVIDDGSAEPTVDGIPDDPHIRVIRRKINRGYGASLKEGIRSARGDIVLTMDSDGQHRPEHLQTFLAAMDDGRDAALGHRQKLLHSLLWRMPGKWMLRGLAQYLIRQRIPDPNCGFRAFRTEFIRAHCHLCPDGFSFSTTSTLILLSQRMDVAWIPVDVGGREGKSTVRIGDGFLAMLGVLRIIMLFNPLRVLLPPSIVLSLAGTASLVRDITRVDITQGTVLLLLGGMLLFSLGLLADQVAAIRRGMS